MCPAELKSNTLHFLHTVFMFLPVPVAERSKAYSAAAPLLILWVRIPTALSSASFACCPV